MVYLKAKTFVAKTFVDCYSVHRKLNRSNQQTIQNQGETDMSAFNQNIKQIVVTGEKLFIGASVAVGMSAAVTAPAMAAGITGATVTGNDIIKYDVRGSQTYANPAASLDSILQGNSSSPGGNLELFGSSETAAGAVKFTQGQTVSLSGTVGGQTLTLSSLNVRDWFWDGSAINKNYGANTFANQWFNDFYSNAVPNPSPLFTQQTAFTQFENLGGFLAASDPNISYIDQIDSGDINIGLAGHFDLKAFYQRKAASTGDNQLLAFSSLIKDGLQASEVVKYTYNGTTDYLYSFDATQSGLLETDGWSHNGNYEVTISGNSEEVPEPITGLIAAAGLGGAALRRMKKSQKS